MNILNTWTNFCHQIGRLLERKIRQTRRFSRKTIALVFLLIGAMLVATVSLLFARMADWALEQNAHWAKNTPLLAWIVLPLGLMLIVWFTRRFAPHTSGSGIPQVIACLSLPYGTQKTRLVRFGETILKIPFTFLAILVGASVGREGPSVQVGAAVMSAWGAWCKRHNLAFKGLQENDLLAAGAAGGLAAAFNAPLAGVIFAIEELGRGVTLRWDRQIFIGVLTTGLIVVAIDGNNPYFSHFFGSAFTKNMFQWVLLCSVICGVSGGLFALFLSKGVAWVTPVQWRGWVRNHPIWLAGVLGLMLAVLGTLTQGSTYGTGYNLATAALQGETTVLPGMATAKWLATVLSYWAGIPGGIFTPALTTGALIGVQISQIADLVTGSNVLVLLCMTAFLAAATQAPLTSGVVVMEMTGSQSLLFWLLLAGLLASVVSRQISPKPFYHFAAERFRQRVQEAADK
ncbi:chloride channel protein [Stenoxybacter acetivorans]|uniref:chloride channel protein n=1 Tax=Stenoxybacter acetivorans TaxID=422441 RepID=UPI000A01EE81|nr:chloride channel protein [Stenoxybacter acetivorans]